MRFVLDNNLPPKLAFFLKEMDVDIVHLRELYDGRGDIPDVQWIADLAKNGDVMVTFDRKITSRKHERAALESSGLTIFFVAESVQDIVDEKKRVAFFLGIWSDVQLAAENARRGRCWFQIQRNGKVTAFEK